VERRIGPLTGLDESRLIAQIDRRLVGCIVAFDRVLGGRVRVTRVFGDRGDAAGDHALVHRRTAPDHHAEDPDEHAAGERGQADREPTTPALLSPTRRHIVEIEARLEIAHRTVQQVFEIMQW